MCLMNFVNLLLSTLYMLKLHLCNLGFCTSSICVTLVFVSYFLAFMYKTIHSRSKDLSVSQRGCLCPIFRVYSAELSTAMVFPVVMYGCENWTIKKSENQRTDALELQCWRRLLRVPWTARRSNQSILKEISSEYSF